MHYLFSFDIFLFIISTEAIISSFIVKLLGWIITIEVSLEDGIENGAERNDGMLGSGRGREYEVGSLTGLKFRSIEIDVSVCAMGYDYQTGDV